MNGTHFNQLGRRECERDGCFRARVAGRTEEEMTVLIKRSLLREGEEFSGFGGVGDPRVGEPLV
jgi:hypothetical protein